MKTFGISDHFIKVERGETFEIVLETNPTTGYDWVCHDASGLSCYEDHINVEKHRIGAGCIKKFTFEGQPGSYDLKFEYARKWLANSVAKRHEVNIRID